MTKYQLFVSTWVPATLPPGEQVELLEPWTTEKPPRVLTCVRIGDKVYVVARHPLDDDVCENWRVLT